jgi:hypothetical protein
MTPKVGFILLTHNKPDQANRLVKTLNSMFDYPPIVWHHNFSLSDLPVDNLSENIVLVRPHVQTKWGKFSTLEAELKAIRLMYEATVSPDWFVLLSGADYPIKSANQIVHDLISSSSDVYMHHELVDYHSRKTVWQKLGFERYCILRGWYPALDNNFRLKKKFVTLIENPEITKFFTPFSEEFPCFVGDHSFCANRKAANYLLDFHEKNPALASYYRKSTIFPTESYYHTIFGNAPDIQVENDNLRYIDWPAGSAHPKTLLVEDLERMTFSTAHFARKFDIDVDAKVLDELDTRLMRA